MNWDWDKLQEKKQKRSPSGSRGGGGGPTPPDFDEFKRKLQKLKGFKFSWLKIVVAIVVLLWIFSGFYIVDTKEVGVEQRFGAFTQITQAGPHYHWPYPIETVKTPSVTEVKKLAIGFRSSEYTTGISGGQRHVPKEALMLTGDENIVDVQFVVQYRIKDAKNYLFNISQQTKTVKDAAEAAMRDIVGNNNIEAALTTEKAAIQANTKELLQNILNDYEAGIHVQQIKLQDVQPPREVRDAFKDVASAREDKSKFRNQALAYRNQIIPKTRGQVASILNQAEAYKESKIRKAEGESARFLNLYSEYKKAPEVTEERLYLETMEEVLSKTKHKMILSEKAGDRVIPYLPLQQLPGTGKQK